MGKSVMDVRGKGDLLFVVPGEQSHDCTSPQMH